MAIMFHSGKAWVVLAALSLAFANFGPNASAELTPKEQNLLKQVKKAFARVNEWKTFRTASSTKQHTSYVMDYFVPVEDIQQLITNVQFEKVEEEKYNYYTKIELVEDYRIPIIGYSVPSDYAFQWFNNGSFFLRIDKYPQNSDLVQAYPQVIGQWIEQDDDIRGGPSDIFSDEFGCGFDCATALEEDIISSLEEGKEKEIDGKTAKCYKITFRSSATSQLKQGNPLAMLLLEKPLPAQDKVLGMPNRKASLGGKMKSSLANLAMLEDAQILEEHPTLPAKLEYEVCVDDSTGNMLENTANAVLGPGTISSGGHYFSNFLRTSSTGRVYSGIGEPAVFPEIENVEARMRKMMS